jgi:hypothetical protein
LPGAGRKSPQTAESVRDRRLTVRARTASIAGKTPMPDSRLFMSSISRRQLARRRSGRPPAWPRLMLLLLLAAVIAAAFFAGRGSF